MALFQASDWYSIKDEFKRVYHLLRPDQKNTIYKEFQGLESLYGIYSRFLHIHNLGRQNVKKKVEDLSNELFALCESLRQTLIVLRLGV